MKNLILLFILLHPIGLFAQADTIRVCKPDGNILSDQTIFDYQPVPLYGYHWETMSQLPPNNWQPRCNRDLLFPANAKAVALRFWVKNDDKKAQELVLEIDDLQVDRTKIWVKNPNGPIDSSRMSGDKMPFGNRDLAFANPNFKINLDPGQTIEVLVYLDQSGLFLMPRLRLWPIDRFVEYASRRQLVAGLLLGLFLLSTVVFLIVAFLGVSDSALWYAGFISVQTIQIANQLGIGHQFLWPQSGLWSTLLAVLLPLAGFVLLFQLLSVLLDLRQRLPKWHRILRIGIPMFLSFVLLTYLIHLSGAQKIVTILYPLGLFLAIGLCVLLVLCCVRVWQLYREKDSLYFLLAFSCGIAGAATSWLVKTGFSLDFNIGRYGVVVGFVLDLFIFNFLIGRDLWKTKSRNHSLHLALDESNREAAINLLRGEEAERKRLSMALHDGVGIELGSIRRRLEKHFDGLNGTANMEARQTVSDIANVAQQIRAFSHALDPFSAKNLSLPDLIDNLLYDFENNSPDISVNFAKNSLTSTMHEQAMLLSENEKHLFFMAAELLNNIAKHAHATEVELAIDYFPDRIVFEIRDNGIGYSPGISSSGIGMSHIRSRAQLSGAIFQATRLPLGGMLSRVEMPLPKPTTPPPTRFFTPTSV